MNTEKVYNKKLESIQNQINNIEKLDTARFDQILTLLALWKTDSPTSVILWIEIAQKINKKPEVPQVVITNKKMDLQKLERDIQSQTKLPAAVLVYREKKLIIQTTEEYIEEFNLIVIKNRINQALKKNSQDWSVVASITKSQLNQSLIITTMPAFSAEYLIKRKEN